MTFNVFGQPIGDAVPGWVAPPVPVRTAIEGVWCRLEPLDPARHAHALWEAYAHAADARDWTYLFHGPYETREAFTAWVGSASSSADPLFFAIVDSEGVAQGVAAYLRITPAAGTIEVGHINFSPRLQRSRAATESMYLLMARAFALGYRRYEWKCDALNAPSRAAAERLGFSFEGIFRQALVYKGRNRDTAWYAIVDRDWPALAAAFERWLAPGNFDASGAQRARLRDLTRAALQG